MNIFDWFFQWIFPEINLEDFNEPHDSLGGLDFDEKQDILEVITQVHEDGSPCSVERRTVSYGAMNPAIYDPEHYPEGAKAADDYIKFKDATGVAADEESKSFADAERIVPIKLDWNTGTAPKKKVKKVTKKKKAGKKKRK